MQKINVGFLGCGNIGSGVWALLEDMHDDIARLYQVEFNVKKMLVKALDEPRAQAVPQEKLTTQVDDILNDPQITLVCEFMGGEQPAAAYMLAALKAGKNVVTANKMALSLHWKELHDAAREAGRILMYEASVCGAIPVVRTIKTSMTGSRIDKVIGIVNGTTNYILSQMLDKQMSYDDALAQAQELGLAEPDPTSDVEGFDAAYKLSILCALCFGKYIHANNIQRCGISTVDITDIMLGAQLGYSLKLLAKAERNNDGIYLSVSPAFVPRSNQLYHVKDAFNAVMLHGHACDDIFLFGRGAGAMPTASAVVADMIRSTSGGSEGADHCDFAATLPSGQSKSAYYIRLSECHAVRGVEKANEVMSGQCVKLHMTTYQGLTHAVLITPEIDPENKQILLTALTECTGEMPVCWPIEETL